MIPEALRPFMGRPRGHHADDVAAANVQNRQDWQVRNPRLKTPTNLRVLNWLA